jgi:hypothetical protein
MHSTETEHSRPLMYCARRALILRILVIRPAKLAPLCNFRALVQQHANIVQLVLFPTHHLHRRVQRVRLAVTLQISIGLVVWSVRMVLIPTHPRRRVRHTVQLAFFTTYPRRPVRRVHLAAMLGLLIVSSPHVHLAIN